MVGKTISHYRILSVLGKGGMGVVYKAEDIRLGRLVAVKFLPEEMARDNTALERFRREARAVSALNHPNICTLHDIDLEAEQPFLVMELIEGQTLRQRIHERPLSFEELLDLAIQITEALDSAHAGRIVHRDIKPANILLTPRGQIKVMDFGLAKMEAGPDSGDSVATAAIEFVTSAGSTIGTVAYMSPEQARGEKLDTRSDLFSLGVVLYEMATGKLPFHAATTAMIFVAILHHACVPPTQLRADVPPDLERIIQKALEKDRDMRYQTAADIRADLKRLRRELAAPSTSTMAAAVSGRVPAAGANPSSGGSRVTAETATTQEAVTETLVSPQLSSSSQSHAVSSAEYLVGEMKRHRLGVLAGVVLLLLIGAAASYYFLFRDQPIESIAVLPFENVGAPPGTEYLGDGIAESIINSVSQLPKLSVRSFSSVSRFRGKDLNPMKTGNELKVQAVLTGRIVHHGDEVSINTELIDVRHDRQIWGSQYNRKMADLIAVQEQISHEVADRLETKFTGEEQKRMARGATADSEAYQLYLQGRYHWNKRTLEDMQQAIDFFGQAIQRDPRYALAYAGQADAYALLADFNVLAAREVLPKVKGAADKAIELDPTLAEAHASLGWALYHQWDWVGAENEFKKSIQLNAAYAPAHSAYGDYLVALGRFDEALTELNRARELDPSSPVTSLALGMRAYYARDYTKAIEQCEQTLAADSQFVPAHVCVGRAYEQKRSYAEAIRELQKALDLSGGDTNEVAALGRAYALWGRTSEAQRTLADLTMRSQQTYVQPAWVAVIHAALGDTDQAFDWLEKAFVDESASLVYLKVDPAFDPVRKDPRFADLVRRVGLPAN
jgi:serine/threonine protein kinase/tetratricopeptide (TPR) repeat protein